jgi:hypothetical protein
LVLTIFVALIYIIFFLLRNTKYSWVMLISWLGDWF